MKSRLAFVIVAEFNLQKKSNSAGFLQNRFYAEFTIFKYFVINKFVNYLSLYAHDPSISSISIGSNVIGLDVSPRSSGVKFKIFHFSVI